MDGANVTLDIKTERLRQFPEAYEMLQHIQVPEHRILMKQQVIFQYEAILRKQLKVERKKKKKEREKLKAEMQKKELQPANIKAIQSQQDKPNNDINP